MYDKTIKVWNSSTGVCERTLEGHTGYVRDIVILLEGKMFSVSNDCSAKIWNLETGVCDLTVQVWGMYCLRKVVQLHDGQLAVSYLSDDKLFMYLVGA